MSEDYSVLEDTILELGLPKEFLGFVKQSVGLEFPADLLLGCGNRLCAELKLDEGVGDFLEDGYLTENSPNEDFRELESRIEDAFRNTDFDHEVNLCVSSFFRHENPKGRCTPPENYDNYLWVARYSLDITRDLYLEVAFNLDLNLSYCRQVVVSMICASDRVFAISYVFDRWGHEGFDYVGRWLESHVRANDIFPFMSLLFRAKVWLENKGIHLSDRDTILLADALLQVL